MPANTVSLYQYPDSSVWWVRYRVSGRQIRRSTGERDRSAAQARGAALYAEDLAAVGAPHRGEGVDLAQLGGLDHERAVAGGATPKQQASIISCWRHLVSHLGADTPASAVTYDLVESYVARRRQEGARGQSIRKEVQALRRGLRIAVRRGWLRQVPDAPTVRSDAPRGYQRGHLHDAPTLARWLEALDRDPRAKGARLQAEVVLRTGLRAEEARRLRWSWVEGAPEGSGVPAVLRVPAEASKTRRERIVGLTPRALELLAQAHEGDELVCPGAHLRSFRAAAKAVGLPSVTLRDLRHCHATWAAQGTGDAAAAQAALGHSDLATTQRYLHTTVARVAGAAVAVDQVLEQSPRAEEAPEAREATSDVLVRVASVDGRGERIRTSDFLLPKQAEAMADYLVSCSDGRFEVVVLGSVQAQARGGEQRNEQRRGAA